MLNVHTQRILENNPQYLFLLQKSFLTIFNVCIIKSHFNEFLIICTDNPSHS